MMIDENSIKKMLERLEAKIDTVQEELKRQWEAITSCSENVNITKKNSNLIVKILGNPFASGETNKPKHQSTLQNWVKKPPQRSPEKLDLTKLANYAGGQRKSSQPTPTTSKHDSGVQLETQRFSASDPTPLPTGGGSGTTSNISPAFSFSARSLPKKAKQDKPDFIAEADIAVIDITNENDQSQNILHSPKRKMPPPPHKECSMSPVFLRQRPPAEFPFAIPPSGTVLKKWNPKPPSPQKSLSLKNANVVTQFENVKDSASKQIAEGNSDDDTIYNETDMEDQFPPTPPAQVTKRTITASMSAPPPKANSSSRASWKIIPNFDRLPQPQTKEPNFAYKPEKAIRKKAERKNLPGWDCPSCRDYYEALGSQMPPEDLLKLRNKCSKHRSKLPEPDFQQNTPRYFWDLDFPSTQECLQNGLIRIGERSQVYQPSHGRISHQ